MATQKDVAQRAGVSFITVSRVVNNLGNVKADTRAAVEAAIRELNYYPNRQAQALNNGLTHTLALVTPKMAEKPLFNNFFIMSLLSGVAIRGRELGWDVLMSTDYDHAGDFDYLRVWHQRKVDGLIFLGLKQFTSAQLEEIETMGVPCVIISDRVPSKVISWVDTRNAEAAQEIVHRFHQLGHRHLAFLGVDMAIDYNPNFRDRERMVRETCADLGIELDVFNNGGLDNIVDIAPRQYLAQPRRATAVIAGNDTVALGFMADLAKAGLVCPRDYSIVGFDAEPAGQLHQPALTSYRQPLLDMGQAAVQILVDRMTGHRTDKVERTFPLEYVEGGSVAPRTGS